MAAVVMRCATRAAPKGSPGKIASSVMPVRDTGIFLADAKRIAGSRPAMMMVGRGGPGDFQLQPM